MSAISALTTSVSPTHFYSVHPASRVCATARVCTQAYMRPSVSHFTVRVPVLISPRVPSAASHSRYTQASASPAQVQALPASTEQDQASSDRTAQERLQALPYLATQEQALSHTSPSVAQALHMRCAHVPEPRAHVPVYTRPTQPQPRNSNNNVRVCVCVCACVCVRVCECVCVSACVRVCVRA